MNARICKNNVGMFLLAGKTLETFSFISFYWLSLHFDSQSLQKCVKKFLSNTDAKAVYLLRISV